MDPESQIDDYLRSLPAWQSQLAARIRALVHDHVKANFFKGASLPDPAGLFNAGLEAKATRAIDLAEGDHLDEAAFRTLVKEAVAANTTTGVTR